MEFQKREISNESFLTIAEITDKNPINLSSKILSEKDRILFKKAKCKRRKDEFLGIRQIVREYFPDSHIEYKETGAPYLTNSGYQLSISHSKNFLSVLFSKNNCGCDIEVLGSKARSLSHKFATNSEINIKCPVNDDIKYTLIWSVKETLYKLFKVGGLDFKKNIHILAFDFSNMTIETTIQKGEIIKNQIVYFEIKEEYILTWTIDKPYN